MQNTFPLFFFSSLRRPAKMYVKSNLRKSGSYTVPPNESIIKAASRNALQKRKIQSGPWSTYRAFLASSFYAPQLSPRCPLRCRLLWDKAVRLVAVMKETPCTFQPFSNCCYKHMFDGNLHTNEMLQGVKFR